MIRTVGFASAMKDCSALAQRVATGLAASKIHSNEWAPIESSCHTLAVLVTFWRIFR
jgi:hypothetical protein